MYAQLEKSKQNKIRSINSIVHNKKNINQCLEVKRNRLKVIQNMVKSGEDIYENKKNRTWSNAVNNYIDGLPEEDKKDTTSWIGAKNQLLKTSPNLKNFKTIHGADLYKNIYPSDDIPEYAKQKAMMDKLNDVYRVYDFGPYYLSDDGQYILGPQDLVPLASDLKTNYEESKVCVLLSTYDSGWDGNTGSTQPNDIKVKQYLTDRHNFWKNQNITYDDSTNYKRIFESQGYELSYSGTDKWGDLAQKLKFLKDDNDYIFMDSEHTMRVRFKNGGYEVQNFSMEKQDGFQYVEDKIITQIWSRKE